jgi:hypothetical protein
MVRVLILRAWRIPVSNRWWPVACIAWLGAWAAPAPAAAQASRAAETADAQAKKAQELRPYTPNRAEQILTKIEKIPLDPPPVLPTFDSVYSGGGFTPGAVMRWMYGDKSTFAVRGLYSLKQYKLIEAATVSPGHALGRLDLGARVGWRDATQVGYYGLGIESDESARANYRFKETYVEGGATFRPRRWTVLEGRLAYEDYQLEPGKGSAPSIETVYTPATAPGLGASPSFVHTATRAGIDTRLSPLYTRTGGYYGVELHNYLDTGDTFTFNRFDVEAIHHIPILRENWVIALRGRFQTTLGGDDVVVPYFLLPSLGGGSSLRAYTSWRFRDRDSLLANVEWRWIPSKLGFDMAIFYDTGTMADHPTGLSFAKRVSDWGFGARFHAPRATVLRIEMAKGTEGWQLVFASSAPF